MKKNALMLSLILVGAMLLMAGPAVADEDPDPVQDACDGLQPNAVVGCGDNPCNGLVDRGCECNADDANCDEGDFCTYWVIRNCIIG